MTKQQNNNQKTVIENITQLTLEDVLHKSMMPYAEHVILDRALPRVEDGLKPVQRRILYTMKELAVTPDKPHRKCARIVGDCLGKYHPHSDSSVYDALARMAQNFSMRYPLVDGHGNFGSIDGDNPAAMRYTEARMTSLSLEMLKDIDKNTVPFVLNFDDELHEPDLLPSRFPNLLVNGANGIAVGLATNIPPHNLAETIDATIAMLKNPDIDVYCLMKYIKGPDFPTAGIILESDEIFKAYSTGKGKIVNRAKVHFENSTGGRTQIVITEIPYQVNKSELLEGIQKLSENSGPLSGKIYSIRDESDRNGLRAIIETKKDIDPLKVLSILYKKSKLEKNFNMNLVAIANGKPKQLNLRDILFYYIKHQKEVVYKRSQYDLEKSKIRLNILDGFLIALDNIDEVIQIIRSSKNPKIANKKLCERFSLKKEQAQAILDMRLHRLTNLEVITINEEHTNLLKQIDLLQTILTDDTKLTELLIKELKEIKKNNADKRRSIIETDKLQDIEFEEEQLEVTNYVVTFTSDGKIQKYLEKTYNSKINISEINNENIILDTIQINNLEKFLILTNIGICYTLDVNIIPTIRKKTDRGLMLNAIIDSFEKHEKPIKLLNISKYNNDDLLLIITKHGMLKISSVAEYILNRSKFIGIKLNENDSIVSAFICKQNENIMIVSKDGNILKFNLSDIKSISRVSKGVSAISLSDNDYVIYSSKLPSDNLQLLIISEKACAKLIPIIDIETKKRNSKGIKCFSFYKNSSNGSYIAYATLIQDNTYLYISQSKSKSSLINTSEIPIQNKSGKGLPILVSVLDDIIESVIGVYYNDVVQ